MATAVARPADWVPADHIRELSSALGESDARLHGRLEAYDRFRELPLEPNPLYRGYGYFTNVDLSGLDAVSRGPAVPVPAGPADAVRVVHDSAGTHVRVPAQLVQLGVRLVPLFDAGGAGPAVAGASDAGEVTDRLSALSSALVNRGYALDVPARLADPVRVQDLTILSRPHEALSVQRTVRVGSDTQLLLTEEVYSTPEPPGGQRLYSSGVAFDLGAGAKSVCLTMHAPDLQAVSVYRRSATTGPGSRLAWLWAGLGGFRTKARNSTRLTGQGSVVDDLQLYYGNGDQSYDSSVHLTHTGTDTHGQSITRGVFTDRARGMSRGLVRIEHEARKTLSFISEHAMLLSRGARSDTIPILEILCRDVKATHSTSVHPVDPEQVFYLGSRGIAEPDAVRMIGEGFLSYVLDRAPIASLRDAVFPALEARWNGEALPWTPDGARALPEMHVTGTETAPEWRFDTKLR
jgi:SUF system FeS cluster assembly, SufBD